MLFYYLVIFKLGVHMNIFILFKPPFIQHIATAWIRLSLLYFTFPWFLPFLFISISLQAASPLAVHGLVFWSISAPIFYSVRPFSLLVMKVDSLTSLGLRSLRDIGDGSVYISNNTNLCYEQTVTWQRVFTGSRVRRRVTLNDIKFNKLQSQCGKMMALWNVNTFTDLCVVLSTTFSVCVCVFTVAEGHKCDPLCSDSGCWGPGPEQCLSCMNHSRHHTCVAQCNIFSGSVCMCA